MARDRRRSVLSTFTSIPIMLLLMGSTVGTDGGGGSGINLVALLIALLIAGLLELGIVIYWMTAVRRQSEGNQQLVIGMLLPVVGLVMVFAFLGGFTACGA
jgi:hypothetical protein